MSQASAGASTGTRQRSKKKATPLNAATSAAVSPSTCASVGTPSDQLLVGSNRYLPSR